MAGPTTSVVFASTSLTEESWREVMRDVADEWADATFCHVADSIKFGGLYRGEPRPFVGDIYEINDHGYCGVTPVEIAAINAAFGIEFNHCIELGAMCKSETDHRLLCEIARFLADRYDGYVNFNDVITDTTCDGLLTVSWVEYGQNYSTQIGSPSACDWWMAQSSFHMIK